MLAEKIKKTILESTSTGFCPPELEDLVITLISYELITQEEYQELETLIQDMAEKTLNEYRRKFEEEQEERKKLAAAHKTLDEKYKEYLELQWR